MKKIDFTDMTVFEKLEDEAIDGVLNYDNFPPEEYKYFSKLAKLGYNNRHKGLDVDICLKKQEECCLLRQCRTDVNSRFKVYRTQKRLRLAQNRKRPQNNY